MRTNFTFRLYKDEERIPALSYVDNITISGITLVSKSQKFGGLCWHKGNQKKFGYKVRASKKFIHTAGSHSTPLLTFKGDYIDIIVEDFPRYPCFDQCKYHARNVMNGYGHNSMNNGFPTPLLYRKIEFINS